VRDNGSTWIDFADRIDAVLSKLYVHVASSSPQIHFSPGLLHHPGAKILIWNKENVAIGWGVLDYFHCITAGTDDIRKRFHTGATVDVGNDVVILVRMLL